MKILVTGARGFVGKNLVAALECIRDGKDRAHKLVGLDCCFQFGWCKSPERSGRVYGGEFWICLYSVGHVEKIP